MRKDRSTPLHPIAHYAAEAIHAVEAPSYWSAILEYQGLSMAEVAAQPNGSAPLPSETEDVTAAMEKMELSNDQDPPLSVVNHTPASVGDLSLPLSAADGLVKKPFAAPLDTAKPIPRPSLSTDQATAYNTLLERVSAWTKLPSTSAKGSPESPLADSERLFLTRECLLRYLRATAWNLTQAETRLKATLVWRREYGVEKLTPDYIEIESRTGKQIIQGWDINARPCHYMNPSKQNTPRSERQIEHLVFMLEREIDLMVPGQETLALLIDFTDTKSGQGASIGQGRQTLNILQNHYPERLGRALVTNVPWYIWSFFKLITPFIDPLTREKLKFNEDMASHVPREQLLKANGGDVEFEYDHEVYWPTFIKLATIRRAEYEARWQKGGKRIGEHEDYLRGGTDQSLAHLEQATTPDTKDLLVGDEKIGVESKSTGADS